MRGLHLRGSDSGRSGERYVMTALDYKGFSEEGWSIRNLSSPGRQERQATRSRRALRFARFVARASAIHTAKAWGGPAYVVMSADPNRRSIPAQQGHERLFVLLASKKRLTSTLAMEERESSVNLVLEGEGTYKRTTAFQSTNTGRCTVNKTVFATSVGFLKPQDQTRKTGRDFLA